MTDQKIASIDHLANAMQMSAIAQRRDAMPLDFYQQLAEQVFDFGYRYTAGLTSLEIAEWAIKANGERDVRPVLS